MEASEFQRGSAAGQDLSCPLRMLGGGCDRSAQDFAGAEARARARGDAASMDRDGIMW